MDYLNFSNYFLRRLPVLWINYLLLSKWTGRNLWPRGYSSKGKRRYLWNSLLSWLLSYWHRVKYGKNYLLVSSCLWLFDSADYAKREELKILSNVAEVQAQVDSYSSLNLYLNVILPTGPRSSALRTTIIEELKTELSVLFYSIESNRWNGISDRIARALPNAAVPSHDYLFKVRTHI